MDSSADPQAFDDKKSEAVPEGAADAAPAAPGETNSMSHALTPFEPKAVTGASGAESQEPPEVESFPGSALVILPPNERKDSAAASAPASVSAVRRGRNEAP